MARILGVSNFNEITTVRALISYVHFLSQEMHLPARVSESVNISEDEYLSMLDEMAEGALTDNCTKTNPRTPTKEEIINIYKSIW
jgi:alcohol dehydrogenase class IV